MAENEEIQLDEAELPQEETLEVDWQAEARKRDSIAKRYKNQSTKLKAELEEERKKSSALAKSDSPSETKKGFDRVDKLFLKQAGVSSDDYEFLEEMVHDTGKPLEDILEKKFVQAELKERQEARATKEAVPSGSKRAQNPTRSDVDYWIAKGELPPDQELARQVVRKKREIAEKKNIFAPNSVIG